ncbi:MAG: hypothetical protein IJ642_12775 [Oscillospiraceae bacterium]|nr:hypothetical protein [Oscillospiraceae bacterium]
MQYLNIPQLENEVSYQGQTYEKIIFLDVDGVLHDYGESYQSGQQIIDPVRVGRVRKIVDATGAEIIMSSSWRYAYQDFCLHQYRSENPSLMILQKYLDYFDLHIRGFTPYIGFGADSRPLEIRAWLLDKTDTRSFVILDDDDFNWQWLNRFLVRTRETISEDEENPQYLYGLEEYHVQKAIEILNQFD